MINRIILLVLGSILSYSLIASSCLAQTASEVQTVADNMRPCVIRTQKPYRFYHYANLGQIVRVAPKGMSVATAIDNHVALWSEYYWQSNNGDQGYHQATDPYESRDFGDGQSGVDDRKQFYLYRVELPTGSRIFNVVDDKMCEPSAEVQKIYTQSDCPQFWQSNGLWWTLITNHLSETCFALEKSVFESLHVIGFFQPYGRYTDLPKCRNRFKGDFVLTDSRGLNKSSVRYFTSTPPPRDTAVWREAVEIEKIYEDAARAHNQWAKREIARHNYSEAPRIDDSPVRWPELSQFVKNGPSAAELEANYIFNCE